MGLLRSWSVVKAKDMFKNLDYEYEEQEDKIKVFKISTTGAEIPKIYFYKTTNDKFKIKFYESYYSPGIIKAINQQAKELYL